jgi:hypothetical protein
MLDKEVFDRIVGALRMENGMAMPLLKLATICKIDYQVLQGLVEELEKSNVVKLEKREKIVEEIVILSQQLASAARSGSYGDD